MGFSFETEFENGVSSLPVGGRDIRPRPAAVGSPNLEVICENDQGNSFIPQANMRTFRRLLPAEFPRSYCILEYGEPPDQKANGQIPHCRSELIVLV